MIKESPSISLRFSHPECESRIQLTEQRLTLLQTLVSFLGDFSCTSETSRRLSESAQAPLSYQDLFRDIERHAAQRVSSFITECLIISIPYQRFLFPTVNMCSETQKLDCLGLLVQLRLRLSALQRNSNVWSVSSSGKFHVEILFDQLN